MWRKIVVCLVIFLFTSNIWAIKVNHDSFFSDYLNHKTELWGSKIDKILQSERELTERNMLEVSNYLYGYIAILLEKKEYSQAKKYIDKWEPMLDKISKVESMCSYVYVYKSAVCAYKIELSKIKALTLGAKAIEFSDKAIELDGRNPIAVGLKGNILFYMPKIAGGDKLQAIEYYKKALTLFPKDLDPLFFWNKCGIMLCLAQAYEKTGDTEGAIKYCKEILKEQPNFLYVKDVYLPALISSRK